MNSRTTWIWVTVAVVLFGVIWFLPRQKPIPRTSMAILNGLKPATITSVQILPKGHQMEILAERTNGTWKLAKPLVYPANSTGIEQLLFIFAHLKPAAYIAASELANPFNADENYGFSDPQFTLIFIEGGSPVRLRLGKLTAPGDQVFLRIVGDEGIYVVDSDLLKMIPAKADEWRDPAVVEQPLAGVDRIAVTNGAKAFVLQRDGTNSPWRMSYPIQARADNGKIDECLLQLQNLSVASFISDEPKSDSDPFGLQPPDLDLTLSQNSNTIVWLQFGKSPTNTTNQVFARRFSPTAVVTVARADVAPWHVSSVNDFRDPHLMSLTGLMDTIEVCGEDSFSLRLQPDNSWMVLPQNFRADPALVDDFLSSLAGLQIADFVKDVVPEKALPDFGLGPAPAREYVLKFVSTNYVDASNNIVADLTFGTNQDKVYARRSDERSVYGIKPADYQRLPSASWQFRQRRFWHFTPDQIARITLRQNGRDCQIVRKGRYEWSMAAGSTGMVEPFALEETVRGLIEASAGSWVGAGPQELSRCGLANDPLQISFELKDGSREQIQFGGATPAGLPFGAVTVDGQPWVFEFPLTKESVSLCRDIMKYLSVPANL